jgi:hypothetical protein
MKILHSVDAFYPSFQIGCEPQAIPCKLNLVEANGRRYLQTPFAFLDAHADDDCERQIALGHYYATESDCLARLHADYPWWPQARPLMEALLKFRHAWGDDLVGAGRLADLVDCSTDDLYQLARGAKRFGLKRVRQAIRHLKTANVV